MKNKHNKNVGHVEEDIMGVKVDFGLGINDVISLIDSRLGNTGGNGDKVGKVAKEIKVVGYSQILCTTNPEFVLAAQNDAEFRNIINESFLSVPDGVGVVLAHYYLQKVKELKRQNYRGFKLRIKSLLLGFQVGVQVFRNNSVIHDDLVKGVSLVYKLSELSAKKGYSIFLLGGWPKDFFGRGGSVDKVTYDLAKKTADKLKSLYSDINIIGATSQFSFKESDDTKTVAYIHACMKENNIKSIDMLLVAYNHVNQEKWLARNMHKIPAKLGIGVGGAFDYISGEVAVPPKAVTKYHLEWLFRLCMQPWRIKRICMAFVVFPIKIYLFSQKLLENY